MSLDCLVGEVDAHGTVTREQLENLGQPLIQKITDACEAALSSAGMAAEQLDAVELIGGCSRTPMIESAIANALKTTPSRTLNCEECVARGAALNAARHSRGVRLRKFDVQEGLLHGCEVSWGEKPRGTYTIGSGLELPLKKRITLKPKRIRRR